MTAGDARLGKMPKWKIEEEPNYRIKKYTLYFVNRTEAMNQLREIYCRIFVRPGAKINTGLDWILYSPSQPHRGDQADLAHTVKAPAFPIPSGGEGLVYSLRWCWDQ